MPKAKNKLKILIIKILQVKFFFECSLSDTTCAGANSFIKFASAPSFNHWSVGADESIR